MRSSLAIKIFSAIALTLISLAVPVEAAAPTGEVEISQLLGELQTAPPSTQPYDRALFVHWIDADGDGCDTRQEVLIEESLTPVVKGSGCTVVSGKWYSWYDGATWTNPTDVDIDHFVPLSEAWKSGAASWTPDRRRAFANDLGLDTGLEAVTDNVNQSKSDQDPSTWVPAIGQCGVPLRDRLGADEVSVGPHGGHDRVRRTQREDLPNVCLNHRDRSFKGLTPGSGHRTRRARSGTRRGGVQQSSGHLVAYGSGSAL